MMLVNCRTLQGGTYVLYIGDGASLELVDIFCYLVTC